MKRKSHKNPHKIMTVIIRDKIPLVVPGAIRRKASFKTGDGDKDEYTPEQRRVIDARLAKGLADIKVGRTYGSFATAKEMITHMKSQLAKRAATKKRRTLPEG